MTQDEQERLEATLRQVTPAAPPEEFVARLRAVAVHAQSRPARGKMAFRWVNIFRGWRAAAIVAPAAAMILLWLAFRIPTAPENAASPRSTDMKANAVQVGHLLVASFDTVAQLPGEEPVRFRCKEWEDEVVVHDDAHGVVITKSTPRVEMVPVRYEIY